MGNNNTSGGRPKSAERRPPKRPEQPPRMKRGPSYARPENLVLPFGLPTAPLRHVPRSLPDELDNLDDLDDNYLENFTEFVDDNKENQEWTTCTLPLTRKEHNQSNHVYDSRLDQRNKRNSESQLNRMTRSGSEGSVLDSLNRRRKKTQAPAPPGAGTPRQLSRQSSRSEALPKKRRAPAPPSPLIRPSSANIPIPPAPPPPPSQLQRSGSRASSNSQGFVRSNSLTNSRRLTRQGSGTSSHFGFQRQGSTTSTNSVGIPRPSVHENNSFVRNGSITSYNSRASGNSHRRTKDICTTRPYEPPADYDGGVGTIHETPMETEENDYHAAKEIAGISANKPNDLTSRNTTTRISISSKKQNVTNNGKSIGSSLMSDIHRAAEERASRAASPRMRQSIQKEKPKTPLEIFQDELSSAFSARETRRISGNPNVPEPQPQSILRNVGKVVETKSKTENNHSTSAESSNEKFVHKLTNLTPSDWTPADDLVEDIDGDHHVDQEELTGRGKAGFDDVNFSRTRSSSGRMLDTRSSSKDKFGSLKRIKKSVQNMIGSIGRSSTKNQKRKSIDNVFGKHRGSVMSQSEDEDAVSPRSVEYPPSSSSNMVLGHETPWKMMDIAMDETTQYKRFNEPSKTCYAYYNEKGELVILPEVQIVKMVDNVKTPKTQEELQYERELDRLRNVEKELMKLKHQVKKNNNPSPARQMIPVEPLSPPPHELNTNNLPRHKQLNKWMRRQTTSSESESEQGRRKKNKRSDTHSKVVVHHSSQADESDQESSEEELHVTRIEIKGNSKGSKNENVVKRRNRSASTDSSLDSPEAGARGSRVSSGLGDPDGSSITGPEGPNSTDSAGRGRVMDGGESSKNNSRKSSTNSDDLSKISRSSPEPTNTAYYNTSAIPKDSSDIELVGVTKNELLSDLHVLNNGTMVKQNGHMPNMNGQIATGNHTYMSNGSVVTGNLPYGVTHAGNQFATSTNGSAFPKWQTAVSTAPSHIALMTPIGYRPVHFNPKPPTLQGVTTHTGPNHEPITSF